jgi:hypothetical protein
MKKGYLFVVVSFAVVFGFGKIFASETANADAPQGILVLPEQLSVNLLSPNGESSTLNGMDGPAQLPFGQYRVQSWTVERKDEKGSIWKLNGSGVPYRSFEIGKEPYRLESEPEPIAASLNVRCSGESYSFSIDLTAPAGQRVRLLQDEKRAKAPTLEITNADKSFNVTLNSSYG